MAITQRGSVLEAADPGSNDYFGSSVALSANGAVMAVGAINRDDAYTDQGGVYIYDWSGSAWVARGSVLLSPDPVDSDYFGSAVALSADGSVLAVGSSNYFLTGTGRCGAVHVFDWSGSAWVLRGTILIAGDAVYSAAFGAAVALSADGAILAVAASARAASYTAQGGVYIYDWSGSAWAQRGSVLVAADAAASDAFGSGVALSSDGAILAVGARAWEGAATDQGGVYIFDASGSAWAQRGSVLVAADAAAYDNFGSAVALSADGAQLFVGAVRWENSTGNQGGVYIYDWSGSAWAQRGSVLEASDAAADDDFGAAVACASDGTVLAVGAIYWEGGTLNQGGVYVYDVVIPATGVATAPTLLTIGNFAVAPTLLMVSYPAGVATAPTLLTVTATGIAAAPTALAMIDMALGSPDSTRWTAQCTIDGVDVSDALSGTVTVTGEEGKARIASLTIAPPAGVVAPLDYVGKTIAIDFMPVLSGSAVPIRLFTGRIDTPAYDINTHLLQLSCVDDLQNRVAALDRSTIDALVGGRYTASVQGDIIDNWDYAQARLTTVAASLDAGPSGGMRLTPWDGASVWATFDDTMLLYQRSAIVYPQRSTLVNEVTCEFDYRYPRLRQRTTSLGFSGTQIDMLPNGFQYPTQQDILGAAGGTGWTVTSGVFYPAPAAIPHSSGGFIYPPNGSIDMAILNLAQRHAQTVTEHYTLTVRADESIAANGTLPHGLRGALASSFDGAAWESALDVAPLMTGVDEQDWAPDAPRAVADYAIQTLLDQANVKILGSHRGARVTNATLCNPDLDVDKRVAISTTDMAVEGKVAAVTHTLDLQAGSAITEFSIACFGAGGAGIITPDSLTAPTPPAAASATHDWPSAIPPLYVCNFGITPYSDSLMGLLLNPPETIFVEGIPGVGAKSLPNPYYVAGSYPVQGFRVQMPGVSDADRNPLDKTVAQAYSVLIPVDTLQFTVP